VELLLALAAVIVAAASLYLANVFHRRSDVYGRRLSEAEQNLTILRAEQVKHTQDMAAAERRANAGSAEQVREAEQRLAGRYRADWQTLADEYKNAQETTSGITRSVSQLREVMTTTLREHDSRLDSLGQLTADHGSRLGSLGQLAAELPSLGDLAADATQLRTEADRQAAALGELRDGLAAATEQTAETLTDLKQQLLVLAKDVELLDLDRCDLRSQLRRWLDHSVRLTSADPSTRILPGFTQAEGRAASEILPCLYEALLRAVNLDFVFREQAGPAGVFYYVEWHSPDGQSPEQHLGSLLATCRDDSISLPGLTELRGLLLAMNAGGPATMRLGPLVVSYTAADTFRGTVMNAEETEILDESDPASSPAQWAKRLGELDEHQVVNLTAWAAAWSS